jgi:hypothetical protein
LGFEGELKKVPLADVLRTIHQNSLSGTLTVKDARGERRIPFLDGRAAAFQALPGEERPVLDALAKRRAVSRADAENARTSLAWKRFTLRRALAYRGLISEQLYSAIVREDVILEGIYELFLESERTFKFEDGAPDLNQYDLDQVAAELRLDAPVIVLEGTRRSDAWARLKETLGPLDAIVKARGEAGPGDSELVREAIRLADGTRTLEAIVEALPAPRFQALEAVAALQRQTGVAPVEATPPGAT